jgi:hypothetical protein
MLSEEYVTITIVITSKVTGRTTIISVPNSRQPTHEVNYDSARDDLVPLEVSSYFYRSDPKLTSVSFTFYPESEDNKRLYTVFSPTPEG